MLPKNYSEEKHTKGNEVEKIFDDFEARGNLVGLYELAYKVDRRVNPHLYENHD